MGLKKLVLVFAAFTLAAGAAYLFRSRPPATISEVPDTGNALEKQNLIRLDSPRPHQVVTSPLEIIGTARGTWYFEASFPVYLYDSAGNQLATGITTAQGDWMTSDFVPFTATLTFTSPAGGVGELVLQKDNPSGLPENADSLHVPVKF